MKSVVIGAHLHRNDIEPEAEALPVADLFLSGVPVDDHQPLGDRDLLLRVAAIRARLLDRATFIAIRYGFAVHTAEEAASKCAAQVGEWRRLLHAHRGEVEMTLKAPAASPAPRPDRHQFQKGADYLRALKAQAAEIDPAFRAGIERLLLPLAVASQWSQQTSAVELAMLVRRSDLEKVRAAGERLRSDFPAVPFLFSGPWPLEVFAHADRE